MYCDLGKANWGVVGVVDPFPYVSFPYLYLYTHQIGSRGRFHLYFIHFCIEIFMSMYNI